MPSGKLFDDGSCNMPCEADMLEHCGAGNRLALYQDSSATPLDPQACILSRQQSFEFQLQAVARQGPLNGFQIWAKRLTPEYSILSVFHNMGCPSCPYDNTYFSLRQGVVTPNYLPGNPQPRPSCRGTPSFLRIPSCCDTQATAPNPIRCLLLVHSLGSLFSR